MRAAMHLYCNLLSYLAAATFADHEMKQSG